MYEISEAYLNLLVCASRFVNTLFGGKHDEMLSSRVYRERIWLGIVIIDTIFFWEKYHCQACFDWETEERKRCSTLP